MYTALNHAPMASIDPLCDKSSDQPKLPADRVPLICWIILQRVPVLEYTLAYPPLSPPSAPAAIYIPSPEIATLFPKLS